MLNSSSLFVLVGLLVILFSAQSNLVLFHFAFTSYVLKTHENSKNVQALVKKLKILVIITLFQLELKLL